MEHIPYPQMNVSGLYLKMCRAAGPVLRELWKPQSGDRLTCGCDSCYLELRNVHFVQDYEYDCLTKRDLENVEDNYKRMVLHWGDNFVSEYNECRELFVWLPYQSQIQQLTGLSFNRMFRMFRRYLKNITKENFNFDFDCLWLDFFMNLKGYSWDPFKLEWSAKHGS